MAEAAFDTLNMARSLERDYDMPAKQAEGVATLVYSQLSGNVATKEDIARVQEDIARVQDDIARVQDDIARVQDDIVRLEENMATKADLARLEQKTATKVDLAEVRIEIAQVRTEIARYSNRQVAILASLIGGLFVINQILPLFGQ